MYQTRLNPSRLQKDRPNARVGIVGLLTVLRLTSGNNRCGNINRQETSQGSRKEDRNLERRDHSKLNRRDPAARSIRNGWSETQTFDITDFRLGLE